MRRRLGNLSIIIRKRLRIGLRQPTRFIRRRSTTFLLTRFMTLVGCKAQKLRRCLPQPSTRMSLRLRQGVLRQSSQVLFQTAYLLQTSRARHRRENRLLLWPRRQVAQLRERKSRVPERQLNSPLFPPRTSRRREQALNQSSRSLRPPHPLLALANQQLHLLRRRRLYLRRRNKMINQPLAKQMHLKILLLLQRLVKSGRSALRERRTAECGLSVD